MKRVGGESCFNCLVYVQDAAAACMRDGSGTPG